MDEHCGKIVPFPQQRLKVSEARGIEPRALSLSSAGPGEASSGFARDSAIQPWAAESQATPSLIGDVVWKEPCRLNVAVAIGVAAKIVAMCHTV